MTTSAASAKRARLIDDLEELWNLLDQLFSSLSPAEWSRRHGLHWTVADVPYHLACFDRENIALPIARGQEVPANVPRNLRTVADLNNWNAAQFALRPAGQTPEQSITQMQASRDQIRNAVSILDDAGLGQEVFCPLPGYGWVPIQMALEGCVAHTWNHLIQLREYVGRARPVPSAHPVHDGLHDYMTRFMTSALSVEEAAKGPFTLVMDFPGQGGGAWTLYVANGTCKVEEGAAANAHLVMTQSPDTFVKTIYEMQNPMFSMLTGAIKVKGLFRMPRFLKLFPLPKPETVLGHRERTQPEP